MGSKTKFISKDQNNPGPGNYNLDDNAIIKMHNGFTMGAKYGSNNL